MYFACCPCAESRNLQAGAAKVYLGHFLDVTGTTASGTTGVEKQKSKQRKSLPHAFCWVYKLLCRSHTPIVAQRVVGFFQGSRPARPRGRDLGGRTIGCLDPSPNSAARLLPFLSGFFGATLGALWCPVLRGNSLKSTNEKRCPCLSPLFFSRGH